MSCLMFLRKTNHKYLILPTRGVAKTPQQTYKVESWMFEWVLDTAMLTHTSIYT